jgi:hypothetical protein
MRQPVAEAYLFQYVCRVFIGFAIAHAPDEQRHRYVFQGTEFRQQVVKLINESKRPVTQPAPFFFINYGYIVFQDTNIAFGGRIQSSQQV